MFSLTRTSGRQRDILEVVLRNGWDYMRNLLTGGKPDEPKLPPPAVLCNILTDLGPVYVKLGQLLSTRPDLLPGKYVAALTDLQANVPTVPWSEIQVRLRAELKQPIEEVFESVDPVAIAAGSIAQTHRAVLKTGEAVALKVQRPGIDRVVEQDITLIRGVAELVALTDFGKTYDIVAIAEEFTTALWAELDFMEEAQFTAQLRQNLAQGDWFDPAQLVVPATYSDLSTDKLLVIEWLEGRPILEAELPNTRAGKDQQTQRQETTTVLFRAFFQQIYVDGFFHADPHPGNIFYLNDGRVALLDCGMIGRLDPRTQQNLTEMLLAIVDLDAQRCAQLTLELSEAGQPARLSRLENDYDRMLRKYYNLSLEQISFSEVFYEVLQIARNNRLRLPSNMGLYAKTLANLEGVAQGFYPQINLIDQIRPLISDLLRRQLLGGDVLQTALRAAIDIRKLSLRSPRQLDLLLDRLTSETLKWNVTLMGLESFRTSIDRSANRLSFSIIVGSLTMGAAIISAGAKTSQATIISTILFVAASFLGLWLIVSILRSGQLR